MRALSSSTVLSDCAAGIVVFLVALPLCLGIAMACGAPPLAGIVAGVVGGSVVGLISKSQTSVSGPAAGLVAVVAASIGTLGFRGFLTAVVVAGLIQSAFGIARAGFIARFIPSSVIKGLLAAIGMLLILKQVPQIVGYEANPLGDFGFHQVNQAKVNLGFNHVLTHIDVGAAIVGISSTVLLLAWGHSKQLKHSLMPAPLVVVVTGVGVALMFRWLGDPWNLDSSDLVNVPVFTSWSAVLAHLQTPDFSQLSNPAVFNVALTIAAVASLETLLNLEAVDKIDPRQRTSPPSLELLAQGVGNVVVGMLGGIPITSVIVRSSVNIDAGCQTRLATIVHGILIFGSVAAIPTCLNLIPISSLAAILLVTGLKLASPSLFRQMWREGRCQFVPFICTLAGILLTDLLIGILVGLAASLSFILYSNFRRPIQRIVEKHLGGDVLRIELANQVSFLNRGALFRVLDEVPCGGHVLLDATNTDYIDPDILDLLNDYTNETARARSISVSLRGFKSDYQLLDRVQYLDYSTREVQGKLTPEHVVEILMEGNRRFRSGQRLARDFGRQITATADEQHPIAVVVSCIDSRVPPEMLFDAGIGDIFSVRIAGNVITREVIGSVEYACAVAGAKVVLIMGHTRCGAVATALNRFNSGSREDASADCRHLIPVMEAIQKSIHWGGRYDRREQHALDRTDRCDEVARGNVALMVRELTVHSGSLRRLKDAGKVEVLGAMYDVATGMVEILPAANGTISRLQLSA